MCLVFAIGVFGPVQRTREACQRFARGPLGSLSPLAGWPQPHDRLRTREHLLAALQARIHLLLLVGGAQIVVASGDLKGHDSSRDVSDCRRSMTSRTSLAGPRTVQLLALPSGVRSV